METRQDKLNQTPLWDCLPKYALSRLEAENLRNSGELPELLLYYFHYSGEVFSIEIHPARLTHKNGTITYYYPSATDELVEEALRNIFSLQNLESFDKTRNKYAEEVIFTIRQVRKILEAKGHTRSHDDILLSLGILSRSIIRITTQGKNNYPTGSYLTHVSALIEGDHKTKWIARFHPLIIEAIKSINYEKYNFTISLTTQLARWLYKYIIIHSSNDEAMKIIELRFQAIKRDSGLLGSYSRNRDAMKKIDTALNELIRNGLILSVKKSKFVTTNCKVEDIRYSIELIYNDTKRMV